MPAARFFGNGKWVNDNISALSSSGFTQFGRTIDLVAPGEGDWAACEPGFASCTNFTVAAAADRPAVLRRHQRVRTAHRRRRRPRHLGVPDDPQRRVADARLVVKQIITGTATDLGLPADEQGAGLLDARAAVEAALT